MTLRAQRMIAGAIVVSLAVGFGLLLIRLTNPSTGDYKVKVALDNADGLRSDSDVKIGGVKAGVVTDLKVVHLPDGRDHATATLALKGQAAPIGAGARAKVRPVNLLGEKFLDLSPGDMTREQPSGTTIPESRTGTSVGLDDVLNALDLDTRTRLGILINEAGVGMTGRASAFRGVLSELPSSLDDARAVLKEIADQDRSLRRLITDGDRVLEPLAARREDLASLISDARRVFAVTAERQAQLGDTIQKAPAGLAELRRTLDRLGATADDLRPAARELQRTAPSTATTLAAIPSFSAAAAEALRTATDVAPTITRLARQTTPSLTKLQPTAANVVRLVRETKPTVTGLAHHNGAKALLYFIQTWARVVKPSDGLGHLFGANLTIDAALFGAVLDRLEQPPARKKAASKPVARKPLPIPAGSGDKPSPKPPVKITPGKGIEVRPLPEILKEIGAGVDGLLSPLLKPKDRSTPAAQGGEHGALGVLDYLLGG